MCTTGVICFTLVLCRLTSYLLILKIVYMSLFACSLFWVLTPFPEVIRPRTGPALFLNYSKTFSFIFFEEV